VVVFATLFYGMIAIAGALLRVQGRLYFRVTQQWSRAILRASGTSVVTLGLEEVQWDAPQVLVCNHNSVFDVLAVASVLPEPYSFVGKKELDSIPFFGHAWKAAGHISIDRSDRQRSVASLRQAGEKLRREGGTVILFPEGTRSGNGQLLAFKKGAFVLAKEAGVSIVPAIIRGSGNIVGRGRRVRKTTVHIQFGEAVNPTCHRSSDELLTTVRERMQAMLNPAEAETL